MIFSALYLRGILHWIVNFVLFWRKQRINRGPSKLALRAFSGIYNQSITAKSHKLDVKHDNLLAFTVFESTAIVSVDENEAGGSCKNCSSRAHFDAYSIVRVEVY